MAIAEEIRDILDLRDQEVLGILKACKVERLAIFGSVARGEATADSDVDLLVDFEEGTDLLDQVGLKLELEELLNRRVHVVTPGSLNKYIRDTVLKEAVYL